MRALLHMQPVMQQTVQVPIQVPMQTVQVPVQQPMQYQYAQQQPQVR